MQTFAEGTPDAAGAGAEALECFFAFFGASKNRDEHPGLTQVWRNFDSRNGHEVGAGILELALQDLAELDAKLLFDTVNAAALHSYTISIFPCTTHSGAL